MRSITSASLRCPECGDEYEKGQYSEAFLNSLGICRKCGKGHYQYLSIADRYAEEGLFFCRECGMYLPEQHPDHGAPPFPLQEAIDSAIQHTIRKGAPDGVSAEERRFMAAEEFLEFLQRNELPTDREGCEMLVNTLEQYIVWEVDDDGVEEEGEEPWSLRLFFKSICITGANEESPNKDWNSFLRSL